MPKIADIEYTPNPNAIKFILKEPVTTGSSRSFQTAEAAQADPLANSLFNVGDVVSVFYMDRFITVNKEDDVSWEDLLKRLAEPIRSAPAATEAPRRPVSAMRPGTFLAPTRFLIGSTRFWMRRFVLDWPEMAEVWRSSVITTID